MMDQEEDTVIGAEQNKREESDAFYFHLTGGVRKPEHQLIKPPSDTVWEAHENPVKVQRNTGILYKKYTLWSISEALCTI